MARVLADETPRVDVRGLVRLARGGRGGPRGRRASRVRSDGSWRLGELTSRATVGGREVWSLGAELEVFGGRGVLRFRYRAGGEAYAPAVELEGEPMRFGGVRWWARCPSCSRRCGVVYVTGPAVACRRCFGLAYRSTRESSGARARRAMERLAEGLGGERAAEWLELGLPPRPARMWRRTYERLAERWEALERRDLAELRAVMARFGLPSGGYCASACSTNRAPSRR